MSTYAREKAVRDRVLDLCEGMHAEVQAFEKEQQKQNGEGPVPGAGRWDEVTADTYHAPPQLQRQLQQ